MSFTGDPFTPASASSSDPRRAARDDFHCQCYRSIIGLRIKLKCVARRRRVIIGSAMPRDQTYRAGSSIEDFCRACKTDRIHWSNR
jgi:hypothetical protein